MMRGLPVPRLGPSRSAKGLAAPWTPLIPDLATALELPYRSGLLNNGRIDDTLVDMCVRMTPGQELRLISSRKALHLAPM